MRGGAETAPPSWKNAAFGTVALSAGAAIGKFYSQKIFFEEGINQSGGTKISQTGHQPLSFGQKPIITRQRSCGKVMFSLVCVCVCVCMCPPGGVRVPITHGALDLTLRPPAPTLGHPQPSPLLLTSGGHDWKPVNFRTAPC